MECFNSSAKSARKLRKAAQKDDKVKMEKILKNYPNCINIPNKVSALF